MFEHHRTTIIGQPILARGADGRKADKEQTTFRTILAESNHRLTGYSVNKDKSIGTKAKTGTCCTRHGRLEGR